MKEAHPKTWFGLAAAGAGLAAFGAQANAQQTIIQDIFTSGSQYGTILGALGSNAPGLAPTPTNIPGGPWQHISGSFFSAKEYSGHANVGRGASDNGKDFASFSSNASDGIALGSYNTGSLHVTADLSYQMQSGNTLPATGAFILAGFSTVLNSGSNYGPSALSTYTGLAVIGAGSLQEYVNGSPLGDPIAYRGSYSAYDSTTLMYTINTTTGAISDVVFGRSRADYSFPTPQSFSHSCTANADIGGSTGLAAGSAVISSYILDSKGEATPGPDRQGGRAGAR